MKSEIIPFLLKFLVFLFLTSCLTPIDLTLENNGGITVVSGQISTIEDQNIVELGQTSDQNRLPNPISDAKVIVIEEGSGRSYKYLEINPGTYKLSTFRGLAGESYHLEVKLLSGQIYRSVSEKLPEAAKIDSISYEVVPETIVDFEGIVITKKYYKLYANSTFLSSNTFLKWAITENFKVTPTYYPNPLGARPPDYFYEQSVDPQRVTLFNQTSTSANSIERVLIASREIDWSFLEKHYFTTYQSAITKESFNYWQKVNILANQVGSIFDSPPAKIAGNIVSLNDPLEKPLGYFQAVNQTFVRKPFWSYDLPFLLVLTTCDFTGSFNDLDYPPRCNPYKCNEVVNRSCNRPSWF